jgi:FMN phosphatase YigB (HAD superfamily)/DNA-binding XRE family transcriptional regulator
MNEEDLGKLIQRARQSAGLTQQELCQKAELSYSTLAKIERGAIKSPSIFTIQRLAQVLNVDLNDLVGNNPTHKQSESPKKRSKTGIRFVFFDINGCLLKFFHKAFTKLSADTGLGSEAVESAFWHYNDAVCRGEITLEDFNKRISEKLNVPTINWMDYYLDAVEPVTEMQEFVKWTSENYLVGLLSNIMPGFIDGLRQRHLIPDVKYDVIIDSSQVGALKPEAKIYEVAQERCGVLPNEILLVDDSRANLMAAEHMDWHVLWFDDYEAKESVDRIRSSLEPEDQPVSEPETVNSEN